MPDGESTPDFDSRPEAIRRTIEARIIDGKMQPGRSPGSQGRPAEGVRRRRPDDRPGADAADQRRADLDAPRAGRRHLRGTVRDPCFASGPGGLSTGTAQSLAENIEIREALNPLLAVSAARAANRDRRPRWRGCASSPGSWSARHPSFETQRLIWAGHHALVELADNELLGHVYLDLLDAAEALIVDVVFPTEGIEGDQERQRIAAHASMLVAVADGNVEAARHHAEVVRLVSRPLREPG